MSDDGTDVDVGVVWDGITGDTALDSGDSRMRHALADAAKRGDWPMVLELLSGRREWINSTRPGGSSWYAPLHQAAWNGAPISVAEHLIRLGAWRTHRNARGERPADVARRRSHRQLLEILTPKYMRQVPPKVLGKLQAQFHAVIRGRAHWLVEEHSLRLPDLEPILELTEPKVWFMVPGMAGGFSYWLQTDGIQPLLISESWCRVVGGSGQRHEITPDGSRLVEEGFV